MDTERPSSVRILCAPNLPLSSTSGVGSGIPEGSQAANKTATSELSAATTTLSMNHPFATKCAVANWRRE